MRVVVSLFFEGNFEKLKEKIKIAKRKGAEVFELRGDSYPKIRESDLEKLKEISKKLKIPFIFTLRSKKEGGKNDFSFERKLNLIEKAINLNFDFLDVELEFLEKLKKNVPALKKNSKTKIILSYHNLKKSPSLKKLREIKKRMLEFQPDIIKIAIFSRDKKTNQKIFQLIKETKREGKKIIGIAMGEKGKETRLKTFFDNYFSYFCLTEKEKTAQGQLSLDDFQKWKEKLKI